MSQDELSTSGTRDAIPGETPHVVPPAAASPSPPLSRAPDLAVRSTSLLHADDADSADDLERADQSGFLAELVAHRQAETPFALGLFGPAGAGKSHFLSAMLGAVSGLGGASASKSGSGPFVSDILVARIDAATISAEPAGGLASGIYEALAPHYPRLAAEARHAGGDPVKAAREIGEHLSGARRRLDEERRTLDTLRDREARLSDSVLFEASGSRVDAYARGNRARIERALRSFGFTRGEPVASYKELVRETAESGGGLGRAGIGLRALWAYQGQLRLVAYAVILFVIAWGAGALRADQTDWLDAIRGMGDKAAPVADWLQGQVHWLGPIATVATLLAIVALLVALLRAARFLQPIFRGVTLLRVDLESRRRDLNSLLAHQTRLVDTLAAEVEAAASHADEAERRATAHLAEGRTAAAPGATSGNPFGAAVSDAPAKFLASLSSAMGQGEDAPRRIVVALDGLDALAPDNAAALVGATRRLLGPGFVTVIVADRTRLVTGFAETDPALANAELGRTIQVAYDLGEGAASADRRSDFARRLLQGRTAAPATAPRDASRSVLDLPWRPNEAETVAALAPFAGDSPRAVKTFVNLYRVARADPRMNGADPSAFTALALALAAHGHPEDWTALDAASRGGPTAASGLLGDALAAARKASGTQVDLTQARRALEVARSYTPRG